MGFSSIKISCQVGESKGDFTPLMNLPVFKNNVTWRIGWIRRGCCATGIHKQLKIITGVDTCFEVDGVLYVNLGTELMKHYILLF